MGDPQEEQTIGWRRADRGNTRIVTWIDPLKCNGAEKKWVRALFLLHFEPINIQAVTSSGMFIPSQWTEN